MNIKRWGISAVLLSILIFALSASPAFGRGGPPVDAGKPDDPGLAHAGKVADENAAIFFADPGVVAVAVTRTADGAAPILVLTEDEGVEVSDSVDGVPVVVNVSGKLVALEHNTSTTGHLPRPVPIGVSTGNVGECSAGTIGARVTDGTYVYALSNNHVYALENNAAIGSNVLQPGRFDRYDPNTNPNCSFDLNTDGLGTLSDFVPLSFKGGFKNTVDAAIALSSTGDLGNATPQGDGYGTPKSATVSATLGQTVQKYGRTTHLTTGTVTGINAKTRVTYDSGTAGFDNQIIVTDDTPVIGPGDSGSLLVTDPGRNPVGLLYAGSSSGKTAIANPIGAVLSAFGVTIDGEGTPGPDPTSTPTPPPDDEPACPPNSKSPKCR